MMLCVQLPALKAGRLTKCTDLIPCSCPQGQTMVLFICADKAKKDLKSNQLKKTEIKCR